MPVAKEEGLDGSKGLSASKAHPTERLGKQRGHQTQWAAQFAVASELCKRGHEVSFTMGNSAPVADLMVISPKNREMFLVDVKGLYRKNPWLIRRQSVRAKLFYVLAYVPTDDANEYFIMTQADVNAAIQNELKRLGRPDTYPVTGFVWSCALPHKGAWHILPQ
jgi:hypothetical protein